MHPKIIENFLFPVHELILGRKTFVYLKELDKTQWFSPDKLYEYRLIKLKNLVSHCYQNTGYYKEIFDNLNIKPGDFNRLEDIKKLPVLNKNTIRQNFEKLIAGNLKNRFIKMSTGGSSGEPLIFYVDKTRIGYDKAVRFRDKKWWGINPGDREIVLWGSPVELSKQDRLKGVRDFLFNSRLLSAFNMDPESMRVYADVIKEYNPASVFGYPNSLYALAKFIKENGLNTHYPGLKAVFTTGEMLYDFQRELINEVFRVPVVNEYGARDAGLIAQECPEGNMHITENLYVESVGGKIVVTNLDSYAMPFLRYETGDIGVVSENLCPCKRNLPVIQEIKGRSNDCLFTTEGALVHSAVMNHIFRTKEGVEQFKVIQRADNTVEIKLVTNAKFLEQSKTEIEREVRERIGNEIKVVFTAEDHIKPDKSGKFRYVISELAEKQV